MEESYLMQTLGNALYWTKAIYPQDPNIDETIKENGEMLLNAYLKAAITAAFKWNTDFELWGESEKESKEKTCVEQGLEGQELEDCQAKEKENDNKKNNEEEEGGADYLSRKDWKDQDLKGDGEGQFASYSDYKASFDTPE